MNLLTLEQILQIYAMVAQATGGSVGLRDLGRLEAAIGSQTQHVFDKALYPPVTEKSAALIRGTIADHPFIDGNKRTAMLAGLTLLAVNGYPFTAKPGEIEDFAVRIAVDKLDIPEIAAWLRQHQSGKAD